MASALVEQNVGGIRLIGYSVAGEETVIAAPELNLCFDIGKAPQEVISCDHLCISHGHPDHTAGLHYYFTQRWFIDNETGTAYLPEHLLQPVKDLMQVWARIEGRLTAANLVLARPGQDIDLRRNLILRPFEVNHGVPALGYAAVEIRHKLKTELVGRSGPELVALKRKGIAIENRVELPLVAYCGDTALGDFLDLDCVRNARVLLLECTFIDEENVGRARKGNHVHLKDLPAALERLRNPHVMLIHLTRRAHINQARQRLKHLLSAEDCQRVSFLMDAPTRRRKPAQPLKQSD